jgi:hypothetical protein
MQTLSVAIVNESFVRTFLSDEGPIAAISKPHYSPCGRFVDQTELALSQKQIRGY